jgi:hypothetical protein
MAFILPSAENKRAHGVQSYHTFAQSKGNAIFRLFGGGEANVELYEDTVQFLGFTVFFFHPPLLHFSSPATVEAEPWSRIQLPPRIRSH